MFAYANAHGKKKKPRNSFYIFSDKNFTAFLGHAAKILLATKCH